MKAIVYEKYGSPDVLRLEEVPKPIPKDNEVLIKVHAASINYIDWQELTGESFFIRMTTLGPFKPKHKILGDDLAGRVEAVGKEVKLFQPGDEVFGLCNCGAFAEFRCLAADKGRLAIKPASVSFEEAAAVPTAEITALNGLRDKGQIQPGQKVLIVGASGGVGTFAVQIAKSYGAEVTAVCGTRNIDMVRSIGADHVIDYTQEDFTKNGLHYDLILALAGYHPISDYKRALSTEGIYVCAGGTMAQYFQALLLGPLISIKGNKKLGSVFGNPNQKDFDLLIGWVEEGKVVPVIDKRYSLEEVPEALRYYGGGQAHGKIVITMQQN
jgi:NADPH:quinone reductase-like Zn-dependent oxidoreductase